MSLYYLPPGGYVDPPGLHRHGDECYHIIEGEALILNPVTGKPYRAQIVLPDGWEFRTAEMASADARATAGIKFDYTHRYGFLTCVAYGPYGLIDAS